MRVVRNIQLIFDPYGIYDGPGRRVGDLKGELLAFREINQYLLCGEVTQLEAPLPFIVSERARPHFASYQRIIGVEVLDVSPRHRIHDAVGTEPPAWLSDQLICNWGLLGRASPSVENTASWECRIASWLVPEIASAATLAEFLRLLMNVPAVDGILGVAELHHWFEERLRAHLDKSLNADPVKQDLVDAFNQCLSPMQFAREWARFRALLPLGDPSHANPLRSHVGEVGGVRTRHLAQRLPLLFPLAPSLHKEVSSRFLTAIRRARNSQIGSLEAAILSLNAIWDGSADELLEWTELRPSSLTLKAIEHLRTLPGWTSEHETAFGDYAPSTIATRWEDDGSTLMAWASDYSRWARSSFLRRELPLLEHDPAAGFSGWLKANPTAAFSHAERSYLSIAHRTKAALTSGRVVILIMVDALAIHLLDAYRDALSLSVRADPTKFDCYLAPVPTITEVCKAAILAGRFPSQTSRDIKQTLSDAYSMSESTLLLGASWDDPIRLRVTETTRLVVYRDNRLDERLHTAGSYRELTRDSVDLAKRLAKEIARLVADVQCLQGSNPLVLLTADHGFTYGPPPATETASHRPLDPERRCIAVDGVLSAAESADEGLTFIDQSQFFTDRNYLAARGRSFGNATISGWKLSHGGLLPEEVIIPLVEWFGEEVAVQWPALEPVGQAMAEQGNWSFRLRLSNRSPSPILGGAIAVRLLGSAAFANVAFPKLNPATSYDVLVATPVGMDAVVENVVRFEVATTVSMGNGEARTLTRALSVERQRQLAEKTRDQSEFEGMFG